MLVWSASQELRWSRKVDSFWLFAIGPQCRITCKAGSKQVSQALLNKLDATIDMGLPSPPTSIHPLNHQASKPAPPQSHSSSRAPIESEVRILVQESSSASTLWVPIQSTLWFLSQSTCTLWLVCSSRAPPMRKASPLHLFSLLPTIISEQSHLLPV